MSCSKDLACLIGKVALYATVTIGLIGVLGVLSAVGIAHLGLGDWNNTLLRYPILITASGLGLVEEVLGFPDTSMVTLIWQKFHEFARNEWF